LIAVNLDKYRRINNATCPAWFIDVGAIFVPFSPQIVAYALENWTAAKSTSEQLGIQRQPVSDPRLRSERRHGNTPAETKPFPGRQPTAVGEVIGHATNVAPGFSGYRLFRDGTNVSARGTCSSGAGRRSCSWLFGLSSAKAPSSDGQRGGDCPGQLW